MNTVNPWAMGQAAILQAGWERLQRVLDRVSPEGLDRPLSAHWTVKEMLAHLAFWEETSVPVIETLYRGGPEIPVEQWYGGDDLELAPSDPWPDADTHNAREARWARSRDGSEVVNRLSQARQKLIAVLSTVTEEEARGPIGEQWAGQAICKHMDDHLAKIA